MQEKSRKLHIMPKLAHRGYSARLPEFCNMGVMLRIVAGAELLSFSAAWLKSQTLLASWQVFFTGSLELQPTVLLALLGLCAACRFLKRLSYIAGMLVVCGIVLLSAFGVMYGLAHLFADTHLGMNAHDAVNTIGMTLLLLGYFHLFQRALSPALVEARLQALQARIRPHFLFNSLNAVLSLIRNSPQHAELALENLAELYRAMLADTRQLGPLTEEVALSRQYLELESLRLGERLHVAWHLDNMPPDALVPPLLLQPLLENAVCHGIEPLPTGGSIDIHLYQEDGRLHLKVRNPYQQPTQPRVNGHNMALENIRNRLMLHFDMEASVTQEAGAHDYQVHLILPYRKAAHD